MAKTVRKRRGRQMTRRVRKKYVPAYLTHRDATRQEQSIQQGKDRPRLKSAISRRSSWAKRFEKKYGRKITDLAFINKQILRKPGTDGVLAKGRAAYYTYGSRPNQTQHSWAYARLASVIMGGAARKVDIALWKKNRV
jgi:hypothetical protein